MNIILHPLLSRARRLPGSLSLILLLFATGCVADGVLYQPPQYGPYDRDAVMLNVAPGIDIAARFLPPPENSEEGSYWLLYSHGNAEDIGTMRHLLQQYRTMGFGVAAYDYEGYGRSGGTPSEAALYRDVERVWGHLTREMGVAPENIILYGRSLGSGPACWLAERVDARALVLESAFTSAFAVANCGWLPGDRFPNRQRIGKIAMPLLIIHGTHDEVIPPSHGQALYRKAAEPKYLYEVPGAGHNNVTVRGDLTYWQTLREFAAGKQPEAAMSPIR